MTVSHLSKAAAAIHIALLILYASIALSAHSAEPTTTHCYFSLSTISRFPALPTLPTTWTIIVDNNSGEGGGEGKEDG